MLKQACLVLVIKTLQAHQVLCAPAAHNVCQPSAVVGQQKGLINKLVVDRHRCWRFSVFVVLFSPLAAKRTSLAAHGRTWQCFRSLTKPRSSVSGGVAWGVRLRIAGAWNVGSAS